MTDQSMSRSSLLLLFPLLLLLSLPAVLTAVDQSRETGGGYCCLPMKWHSQMVKTNEKEFKFLRGGIVETSVAAPIQLDVYVNYRRPKFELRTQAGSSVVFWRGYLWMFAQSSRRPKLMNPVPQGFRPSGGLAPFFFRCFAARNGFIRMNATHYRLTEPDSSAVGRRLRLATVTDIYVTPERHRKSGNRTCRLREFVVTSTYPKSVPEKGLALVRDTDAYRSASEQRMGWPDRSLTEKTRINQGYYWSLVRDRLARVNRPHMAVNVTSD